MPVELQIRWDLSMENLLELKQAGVCVFKTPHVGNWYTNNLACAQLGIPMKVVDQTIGKRDKNFHPHCVIARGNQYSIADGNVLTSHAKIDRIPLVFSDRFPIGGLLCNAHMQAVRDSVPDADLLTETHYYARFRFDILRIFEAASSIDLSIWNRKCTADGTTTRVPAPRSFELVKSHGIRGLHGLSGWGIPLTGGWIPPNILNILTDITLDPSWHGSSEVYELSGPDMYRYIDSMMPLLSKMYDAVRAKVRLGLPETMIFNIVPVSDMRFAVPLSRRAELDALVGAYLSLIQFNRSAGQRIQSAGDRRTEIEHVKRVRSNLQAELRRALGACPDVLYRIEDATFFSQYDLLASGESLYIHPWALRASMEELRDGVRFMRRVMP